MSTDDKPDTPAEQPADEAVETAAVEESTTVVVDDEPTAPAPAPAPAAPESAVDDGPGGLRQLITTSVSGAWVMLVCGLLGMAASIALTLERIELFLDPNYIPSCSINPVLSCGSVMKTEQAAFFGFPNPLLGPPAFAVILVTAVLMVGRVRLPRWYWIGQTLGLTAGVVFINYLAFQSIYRIEALCPYCMVVWAVTPIILVLSLARCFGDTPRGRSVRDWAWVALFVWYVIVLLLIGEHFWYYWKTLF